MPCDPFLAAFADVGRPACSRSGAHRLSALPKYALISDSSGIFLNTSSLSTIMFGRSLQAEALNPFRVLFHIAHFVIQPWHIQLSLKRRAVQATFGDCNHNFHYVSLRCTSWKDHPAVAMELPDSARPVYAVKASLTQPRSELPGRQFRALLRAQQPSDTVQIRQVGHKFIGTDFGDFDKPAIDNAN